ncbi:unnamed protein product [Somion occarium]|uniref:Uncharacterized protein n=1 Tax=Somion occarium TaxID=3059160 RepID=A0ABP1DJI2_9APHY
MASIEEIPYSKILPGYEGANYTRLSLKVRGPDQLQETMEWFTRNSCHFQDNAKQQVVFTELWFMLHPDHLFKIGYQESLHTASTIYLDQIMQFVLRYGTGADIILQGLKAFPLEILNKVNRRSVSIGELRLYSCRFGSIQEFHALISIFNKPWVFGMHDTSWPEGMYENVLDVKPYFDRDVIESWFFNMQELSVTVSDPFDLRVLKILLDIYSIPISEMSITWKAAWNNIVAKEFREVFALEDRMFLEKLQINIESQSSTEDHMELDGNLRTDDDLSWIVALLPNRFSDGCRVEVELDFSEISAPEKTLRLPNTGVLGTEGSFRG